MWNEVYAPRSPADLVWSRQKQEALLQSLRSVCDGAQRPRTWLLHGPSGCGKLSTLCVLLHHVAGELATASLSRSPKDAVVGTSPVKVSKKKSPGQASAVATAASRRPKKTARSHEALNPLPEKDSDVVDASSASAHVGSGLSASASAALNSASECTAVVDHVKLHVYHTCDNTLQRYSHVLRSILLEIVERTETEANAHSSRTGSADGLPLSSPGSPPSVERRAEGEKEITVTAHIIKLYGERASDDLHTYTTTFMRQYEQLLSAAAEVPTGNEPTQGRSPGVSLQSATDIVRSHSSPIHAGAAAMLTHKLRRHLIFFIHTTHDTHSHKVDLNRALPSALLQSQACETFHCTPITAINLKRRVQHVLACEAARMKERRTDARADGLGTLAPPRKKRRNDEVPSDRAPVVHVDVDEEAEDEANTLFPSTSSSLSSTHDLKRNRSRHTPVKKLAGKHASSISSPAIPAADLDAIVASGQGDVRQTLLQAQWASLACRAEPPRMVDENDSNATLRLATLDCHAAVQYMRSLTTRATALESEAARGSSTPQSDAILISDSDDDRNEKEESHAASHGDMTQKARTHIGKAAPLKAPSSPHSPSSLASGPRSVLDLLDEDQADTAAQPPSAVSPTVLSAASTAAPSSVLDRRHVIPTARDEYLDLSHATARLLTQKYTLEDVTSILNVPPRKLLEYMMNNNLPHYFAQSQMEACAACAEAGSGADALRAMDVLGAGGNYRRHQLASLRTSEDAADGTAASQIDTIALMLYDRSCRVHHADVCIPRNFAAMRPAPYLHDAYPRLRETEAGELAEDGQRYHSPAAGGRRGQGRSRQSYGGVASSPLSSGLSVGKDRAAFTDLPISAWSEREWRESARARLANPPQAARLAAPWQCLRRLTNTMHTADDLSRHVRQAVPLPAPMLPRPGSEHGTLPATPPVLLPDMDILREFLPDALDACSAAEPLVLDYAPYAQFIVLCRPPSLGGHCEASSTAMTSAGHKAPWFTSPASTPTSVSSARRATFTLPSTSEASRAALTAPGGGGPRRTTFSFTAAPAPQRTASSPRLCTELRMAILRRGLPASTPLRQPHFSVCADDACAGQRTSSSSTPLIPEGDIIDEYSD